MRARKWRTMLGSYALAVGLSGVCQLVPVAVAAQVFNAPRGEVENVRFEQAPSGSFNITYDLVSEDARAVFEVSLEVSGEGGSGVSPKTVSGDIGLSVSPGLSKRIVWDAPKDGYTNVNVDQFRFRVVARAGRATAGIGTVRITSTPAGATVLVDGANRGRTPLTLSDVAVGKHEVTMQLPGYLENRRTVEVRAGQNDVVGVELTRAAGGSETAGSGATTEPSVKKGGVNKLVWVGLAAGAAAAGIAAASGGGGGGGGGETELPCPGAGCPVVTCMTFTASNTNFDFAASGGEQTFTVNGGPAGCTGGSLAFGSPSASWFRVSPTTVTGPSTSVRVSADASTSAARNGTVALSGQTINVAQASGVVVPPPCTFRGNFRGGDGDPPGSNNTTVPGDCEGCARRQIDIEASASTCTWSVDGAPSWFAEIQQPPTGSGSILFQVYQRNTTGRDRTADFFVAGVRFTVRQCAGQC